jgi:hypothetical protein
MLLVSLHQIDVSLQRHDARVNLGGATLRWMLLSRCAGE